MISYVISTSELTLHQILLVYRDLKNGDITSEKLEGPLFAHENQAEYGRVLHY